MFSLTLKAILASFEKVQTQLDEFIASQEEKLKVNFDKQSELANAAESLTADKVKAERVLGNIKKLVE